MDTHTLAPTGTDAACPVCGHRRVEACGHCHAELRALRTRYELRPGRGAAIVDLLRGLGDVGGAGFALIHDRAFVGRLRLPVLGNLVAFVALVAVGVLWLAPLCKAAFAGPWWLFDGVRQASEAHGPALWLLTIVLLLGPPLLDVACGALQEPLRVATETAMLGPPRGTPDEHGVLRLHERAQVLAAALLSLPIALPLALVPYAGLPVVLLLGAAMAAVVWFEPPMVVRGLGLRARLHVLWRNRWRALGVGAGLQLAVGVPFLNLLGLAPVATIATTAAYLQFEKVPPAPTSRVAG
ncbi:MAG: EI24 domain-containing protein [Planctomycetes bacterium]|nr:EI24 domain-containing protein [Planctomycetota bacterium]